MKISQTKAELNQQLEKQLELLEALVMAYDSGATVIAKSIATTIRVLLHDTSKSESLIRQLGMKESLFYDTAEIPTRKEGIQRAGSYSALVAIAIGSNLNGFVPYLDDMPGREARWVPFNDYWNEVVFIDQDLNTFTRREVVLYISNQDGGAHVDPRLDEKYIKLARKNSLGWWTSGVVGNWEALDGAELATVRQIAHEVLKTFRQGYESTGEHTGSGIFIGGGGFEIHTAPSLANPPRRKDLCPCGSGKKFKRCHGN